MYRNDAHTAMPQGEDVCDAPLARLTEEAQPAERCRGELLVFLFQVRLPLSEW